MTTEHADKTTRIFTELVNIVYPNWEVDGDASADLKPENINYRYSSDTNWYIATDKDDNIALHLDEISWRRRMTEENLGLMIFLCGHLDDSELYSRGYWDDIVRIYRTLEDQASKTCEIMDVDDFDWIYVKSQLIELLEERRKEMKPPGHWETNGYERRLKLAEKLDYPQEEIDIFSGMNARIHYNSDIPRMDVSTKEIAYERHSFEEVREWLKHSYRRSAIMVNKATSICCPIAVDRGDTVGPRYEIIDGDIRVNFQDYWKEPDSDSISIHVVDEELIENEDKSKYPLLRFMSSSEWKGKSKEELLRDRTSMEDRALIKYFSESAIDNY